jgi:UDP-glucose 4-epimerase
VARLVEQCIENTEACGIYNVGSRHQVTLEEQIDGIIEVFTEGMKSNKVYRPDKPDALFNHLDIRKTVNDLGYNPQYDYLSWLKDFKEEERLNRFEKLWGKKTFFCD